VQRPILALRELSETNDTENAFENGSQSVEGVQFARGLIVYMYSYYTWSKVEFYSRLCCSPNNVVSQCFNWFSYSNATCVGIM